MASQDEISSAEKLLESIRAGSAPPDGTPVRGRKSSGNIRGRLSGSIIPTGKKITLGVDIGRSEVKVVKVVRISGDRWKLLDCVRIPFEPGVSRSAPRFHEFLRSSVSAIARPAGKCDVWTLMSTANLDVRYITIPKVPKARIPNAVYWTVKRETNFNEKENIIDYEVHGEVVEKGIAKIAVMACIIPLRDLDEVRDLFSRSGLTVRGITVAPFAMQNLLRSGCVPRDDKPVGMLHIGDEHSRIDVFSKGNLVLTRGMKAGIDSMIEAFAEEVDEKKLNVSKAAGEQFLAASENAVDTRWAEAKAVLLGIFSGAFSREEPIGSTGLREQTVFEMIRPALDRLSTQVERTFEHYSLTLQNERVDSIYISCAAGNWQRPFDFIADQLGVQRKVLDPLNQGAILSGEGVAPPAIAERAAFTAATGLALSDSARTPNLIFTYKDKEELGKIARINRAIFCGFLAVMLVLIGVFFWQDRLAGQKEAEVTRLQRELDGFNPQPNQNMVAALAAKVIAERRSLVEKSNRLVGTAVIGELVSLTPPNVRLLVVRAVLGSEPDERDKKSISTRETKDPAGMKEARKTLVLEGIVTGKRDVREASLAAYLMKLSASRLFVHPAVSSNNVESYPDEGEVLRFSLKMGLL